MKKTAKKVASKAPVKKNGRRATLATICAEVARDNPNANFNRLCKLVEVQFRERGIMSYVIQNAVNDVLDMANVFKV